MPGLLLPSPARILEFESKLVLSIVSSSISVVPSEDDTLPPTGQLLMASTFTFQFSDKFLSTLLIQHCLATNSKHLPSIRQAFTSHTNVLENIAMFVARTENISNLLILDRCLSCVRVLYTSRLETRERERENKLKSFAKFI